MLVLFSLPRLLDFKFYTCILLKTYSISKATCLILDNPVPHEKEGTVDRYREAEVFD